MPLIITFLSPYNGFPPEPASPEQTAADASKAGITMSREAALAKRDELSYLVSTDIWRYNERVGGPPQKGSYARINYDKIHPGMTAQWASLESNGWKQLAEAAAKDHGTGWRVALLMMPGGINLAYNAMTIDIFPSWEAMGAGFPSERCGTRCIPIKRCRRT